MSAQTLTPRASLDDEHRSASTRNVFVSASAGDNANDGRSPDSAVSSFSAAMRIVDGGGANQISLRRGETFILPPLRVLIAQSLRLSTYGIGVRPRLICADAAPRFETANESAHLTISGIDFSGSEAEDGCERPDGVRVGGWLSGVTFEDCRFTGFRCGLTIRDTAALRLWRCIFADSPLGADLDSCADAIVEECIFDAALPGHEIGAEAQPTEGLRLRNGEHAVIRECIFHGAGGAALDADCFSTLVQRNLFLSNAAHVATSGATAFLTGNVLLGGNHGPDAAGAILRNVAASLHANVFAQRHRNPGPAVRIEPSQAASAVRMRQLVVRGWKGGCIEVRGGGLLNVERGDLESASEAESVIRFAHGNIGFAGLQNTYRLGPHHSRKAFRSGRTLLTFEDWRQRCNDLESALLLRLEPARVLLPKRFLADARAQAFSGWHHRLRAAVVCDRIRARLGLACD